MTGAEAATSAASNAALSAAKRLLDRGDRFAHNRRMKTNDPDAAGAHSAHPHSGGQHSGDQHSGDQHSGGHQAARSNEARSRALRFTGYTVLGLVALSAIIGLFIGVNSFGGGLQINIALILGVIGTVALGVGLMALTFYSDRSGADDNVVGPGDDFPDRM